jgi:hypothetical protein
MIFCFWIEFCQKIDVDAGSDGFYDIPLYNDRDSLIFCFGGLRRPNPNERKKMKKRFKMGFCAVIIFGLAFSSSLAFQDVEGTTTSQKEQEGEIKELTIKNSGFLSRSIIVIRYRDEDKTIVEVIENGKKLPPSEFPRYESLIREVLEIPQIDRLLPDIDRAKRMAESARISEESKIREMLELRKRLETLDSERARRYRDFNELLLMEEISAMTERISRSKELSQEEKIAQLKEIIEKIQSLGFVKQNEDRQRRLAEIEAANAARMLIEEINKSTEMSQEEKIKEYQALVQKMQEKDLAREESRPRDLVELEAANAIRKMMEEIVRNKDLSEVEKEREFERVFREANKLESERVMHMIGIEKFEFELHKLLKSEGLLPEEEAEFVLKWNQCTIDGKRLPKEIHREILDLCEKILDKKFGRDTKIILGLNEER